MRNGIKKNLLKLLTIILPLTICTLSVKGQNCHCNQTIPLSQEIIDGSKLNVSPGDTICIAAGKRTSLWFENFVGTEDQPIVFINCGGQVVVSNTTKWGISFSYSKYFKVLGVGDPNYKYGIKVDGVATVGLSFNRLSTDFEAAFIEVNKSLGPGCMAKTDPECGKPETWRGNFVMRNINLHDFYIHDVGTKAGGGEGFYLGHSFFMGIETSCGTLYPHDIENFKVHDNIIENTAFDGMQVSCSVSGTEVYNNSIKNYGMLNNGSQQTGMVVGGGTKGRFYNNKIDKGTGPGITVFGQGDVYVFNNVVSNASQDGIFIDDRTTDPTLGFHFYNNTVINAKLNGITMYSAKSKANTFYNNLVVNPGNWSVFTDHRKAFIYLENIPGKVVDFDSANNYCTKDITTVKFADPANLDFHLTSSSPAIDKGRDLSNKGITFDLEFYKRPYGVAFDAGAYEYGSTILNPPMKINTTTTGAKCYDGSDGSAVVTITGGVEPYTYLWSTGSTSNSISGVKAGTYTVKATDNIGNQSITSIIIPQPEPISISSTKINASTTTKGSIDITVSGGTAPYTFAWSNGSTSEDLSDLEEGTYSLVVMDKNSCSSNTSINILKTATPFEIATTSENVTCPGGNTGSALVTISGGEQPYTINWSNGATTNSISDLPGGIYKLSVKDNAGSEIVKEITITEPKAFVVSKTIKNESDAGNDGAINITITGGTEPYSYFWTNNSKTQNIENIAAGNYTVTITDQNGCSVSQTFTVKKGNEIGQNLPPVVVVSQDTVVYNIHNEINLEASVYDPDGDIVKVIWEKLSGPDLEIQNPTNPNLTFTDLPPGTYIFSFSATDNQNATTSEEVKVIIQKSLGITARKFFSPNGDNSGDEMWVIENVDDMAGCQLIIYNESGNKVYESKNYNNNWDGTMNGQQLPTGAYFYVISCSDSGITQRGSVRLLR